MAKNITETFEFEKVSPEELYGIFVNMEKMADITGYDMEFSDKIGDRFSALNGGVTGHTLQVSPGQMIVLSWRWLTRKKEHIDSVMIMVFYAFERGTKIDLINLNIPDDEMPFVNRDTYIEPLMSYVKGEVRVAV